MFWNYDEAPGIRESRKHELTKPRNFEVTTFLTENVALPQCDWDSLSRVPAID